LIYESEKTSRQNKGKHAKKEVGARQNKGKHRKKTKKKKKTTPKAITYKHVQQDKNIYFTKKACITIKTHAGQNTGTNIKIEACTEKQK
jgi:hypothetical protein